MRIIAGKYKGRSIATPNYGSFKQQSFRPTTSKVKEAVFNILYGYTNNLTELRWLDLCCGSGAMGLEALSRGAEYAAFIDKDADILNLLKHNLQKIPVESDLYEIKRLDCHKLPHCKVKPFDLVYCDMPYKDFMRHFQSLFQNLVRGSWLNVVNHNSADIKVDNSHSSHAAQLVGMPKTSDIGEQERKNAAILEAPLIFLEHSSKITWQLPEKLAVQSTIHSCNNQADSLVPLLVPTNALAENREQKEAEATKDNYFIRVNARNYGATGLSIWQYIV